MNGHGGVGRPMTAPTKVPNCEWGGKNFYMDFFILDFCRPPIAPKTRGVDNVRVFQGFWMILDDFGLTLPLECDIIGVNLRGRQFWALKLRKIAGFAQRLF